MVHRVWSFWNGRHLSLVVLEWEAIPSLSLFVVSGPHGIRPPPPPPNPLRTKRHFVSHSVGHHKKPLVVVVVAGIGYTSCDGRGAADWVPFASTVCDMRRMPDCGP